MEIHVYEKEGSVSQICHLPPSQSNAILLKGIFLVELEKLILEQGEEVLWAELYSPQNSYIGALISCTLECDHI